MSVSAFKNSRTFGRRIAAWLAVFALLALAVTSVVMVDETESVIVERFGRIVAVYDLSADRGLHAKLPWPIDVTRRFDRRVQLFEPPGRELFTRDKKNVTVDVYLCWRIAEPAGATKDELARGDATTDPASRPVVRFYRGLGTLDVAQARLDSRIRSVLSTHLGGVELSELLSVEASDEDGDAAADRESPLGRIASAVARDVRQRPDEDASIADRLGIEVVDVRIRRLGFPAGNQNAVFERMRSERRKIAESYRSAGLAENKMIVSRADRQYGEILARAKADADRIRGEGEAEAITILNQAHAQDPELYRVTRTLDAYRALFGEKTTLILSASNQLLKLFTEGVPEPAARPTPPVSVEKTPAAGP